MISTFLFGDSDCHKISRRREDKGKMRREKGRMEPVERQGEDMVCCRLSWAKLRTLM